MAVAHMKATKEENVQEMKVMNQRNRMKLINAYNDLEKIRFFDHTGAVERIGTVKQATERTLVLEFRGGYTESFFYESLIELEAKGKIECVK